MTQYARHNEAWRVLGFFEYDDTDGPPDVTPMWAVALAEPMVKLQYPAPPSETSELLVDELGVLGWFEPADFAVLKQRKHDHITKCKVDANERFFVYQGKEFSVSPASFKEMQGVCGWVGMTGSLPATFPNRWKADDNSYVLIPDVATWLDFYGTMIATGLNNFSKSELLKYYVSQCTTVEELDAIQW